ncbi:D-alanyl-D-alanine carboxypeptidase family protein [Sutcliffiella rhizosphaerae]|uniref:D-alanyl-D-alanine carboxypeptidase DacB n=1 Tax=Sutcliffiella rhizosphaerae TaxID=2880967 RepID=A0ABN8AAV8_9BACI|nr:D-alanyl-D-alanine carboxypeptidase family protein [Sutcliffiella rhizosphaerae]CAG9622340.1 D-alanyl-D-alanine carboxypeptidase DacB [Sutcliffiella rhizosphaerae]
MSRLKNCVSSAILLVLIFTILFPQKTNAEQIGVSARNAVLIEQESGRIIYEKNAHDKERIASITKVMTAILAIESGKMKEIVTISDRANRAEGSSIYLKPGEKIKLEHLVYGLMLRSGNDSAVAIAEHVGGSLEGFVFMMNEKAAEIGMTNTEFANPHGLDDHENHYSTAYDMALITRYAMENETFREISGTKVHRAPAAPGESWDRSWTNKHRLVTGMYEYATGGKTGYTKRAKRTLITTAAKEGLDVIAVTLNGPDDWKDHIYMFDKAFVDYKLYNIADEGKIKTVKDKFYKNKVSLSHDIKYPMTQKEREDVRVKITLIKPKDSWEDEENIPNVVGEYTLIIQNEAVLETPVYYEKKQKKEGGFWNIFKNTFFIGAGKLPW